jgi:hypothetical protein
MGFLAVLGMTAHRGKKREEQQLAVKPPTAARLSGNCISALFHH